MGRRLLLALPLLAIGCGTMHTPGPPATLPAGAIAGLASRERVLPPSVLSAEALDHAHLARLLEQSGYVTGREREFYGRTSSFSHVTSRALRFASPRGAAAYLTWAQAHTVNTVGAQRSTRTLNVGDGGIVVRARGCGCHGETPTFLATWRHGPLVLWLLASGPGADARRVDALAGRLDGLTKPA